MPGPTAASPGASDAAAGDDSGSIAIIGMAGRFPQADTLEAFWENLRRGHEAITRFEKTETQWLPLEPRPAVDDPSFIRARAVLDRPEWFDPEFFRLQPREAALMDPQHRVFLECAWEALEHAGCNPDSFDGQIGVFAGAGFNTYLINNLLTNRQVIAEHGLFPIITLNDKDYLATRVAYKLNLRGPSLAVQTACSTSLVATALACQQLLAGTCDVALAGGVSITFPANRGYHHAEGGILSQDGHCRAFDASATGTVASSGAGVVVLKRLREALAAGDRIIAVIKGVAVNNDGGLKMGFTAPGVDGQAECIATAQAMAGVDAETISYVETHGTATPLGDPIEIAALTKAFGLPAPRRATCAIGSLKTNLGHLDVAAGVAGLIKTALALEHGEIPPSLHFVRPNPHIDFEGSPFFVNASLRPWNRGATPRRAGVSSFGIGGTNAHVVLEEAPAAVPSGPARAPQLLVLSARTPAALDDATENLARWFERTPEPPLADVAATLQTGRKAFGCRRAVVASTRAEAIAALRGQEGARRVQGSGSGGRTDVVFLFPGQGAQQVDMARGLYDAEPAFRREMDEACEQVRPWVGLDLREVLYPSTPDARGAAAERLRETRLTQPALFIVEYALARLWEQWGVQAAAMIGHSLGEYVAACLAGVFTLPDALAVVVERAKHMQAQPRGAMLAVRLSEAEVTPLLPEALSLAALNAPALCTVAGPFEAIAELERKLGAAAIASTRLATSHAFHSAMMEPALAPLANLLRRLPLRPPRRRWISNVTGTWITPAQAMSADYWTSQLRRTVRFADGVEELVKAGHRIFLEVGPGRTLAGLTRQHPVVRAHPVTVATSLERTDSPAAEVPQLLQALGQLWSAGVEPAWRAGVHGGQQRRVVALPTYPFERKRCWIEPGGEWVEAGGNGIGVAGRKAAGFGDSTGSPSQRDSALERTPLPQLVRLFEQLSGSELKGEAADQTFNQLGFDSLFLAQASAAIERRFGVAIPFRELRDACGTMRKVAARLGRRVADGSARGAFPGSADVSSASGSGPIEDRKLERGVDTCVPGTEPAGPAAAPGRQIALTDAQREIWVVSQLGAAAAAAYTEAAVLDLAGELDHAALERALHELVSRHEALRATFTPDGAFQRIAAEGTSELIHHDGLVGERSATAEERAAACLERESARPFDLTRGPLFRPVLIHLGPGWHRLVLLVHHIICDGWSLGILVRELSTLYALQRGGRGTALPRAPRFSAYVEDEARVPRPGQLAAAEAHWQRVFQDGVPQLELPVDRPRPQARAYAGDFVSCTLPPDLAAEVKRFCAERESTVFTGLLAVYAVLLHRLTGQDDIVVGVPTAGQALEGHPDLVGHFANLIPIRSRLRDALTFSALFAGIHREVSDALVHGSYPFMRLLQLLKVPRDASRVPLTPVLFNTTHHRGPAAFGDLTATPRFHPKRHVNFDLNFSLALQGDALSLGCHYSTELLDAATVRRWLVHFETLLRGVLANPDALVTAVPLLTDTERRLMLGEWNRTALPYRREACVHQLFAEQAARTPDAVAVVDRSAPLSYRELDERAARRADELRAAGVKRGVLVGILLERTVELLVAVLAVLKAGGGYVPLDPAHPAQRRGFVISDSRMALIVTQASLQAALPPDGPPAMLVGEPGAACTRSAGAPRMEHEEATPDDLAYVIYTSGSTGEPKGVCVTHRGVVALVAWARQHYRAEELAGVLYATAATFDVSVFESLVPLCLGGRVIIAPSLLQLAEAPAAREATLVSGVPSAMGELIRLGLLPPSVRTVNVAGEPCPQPLVEALYALPQVERVYDLYGPTETTVYSTGSLRRPGGRATIGRPLPNEQVYILDSRQEPVPIGVRGELYIGGEKLARGYLNRPALTSYSFVTLPKIAPGRIYRTGDGARFLADGTIEYLGRLDHQVKVRGYRIELGEIESRLREHPAVADAVATVRGEAGGSPQLLAYFVASAGVAASPAQLRDHLAKWLPGPMLPVAITRLERLPRTTSGKVDRAALPKPDFGGRGAPATAPRTETEQVIAQLWCAVLGLAEVGVHDNFFALGGNSLHAMQLMARLHAALEVEVSFEQFFAAPTVAGLAPVVERLVLQEPIAPVPAG